MTGETITHQLRPEDEIDLLLFDVKPVRNEHLLTLFRHESRRLDDGAEVGISITEKGPERRYQLHHASAEDEEGFVEDEIFEITLGRYYKSRQRAADRFNAFRKSEREEKPIGEPEEARLRELIKKFKSAPLREGEVVDDKE